MTLRNHRPELNNERTTEHSLGCLSLRNLSGVPVIDVLGELNQKTLRELGGLCRGLQQAGHFQLVINATRSTAFTRGTINALARLARQVHQQYGSLTLVTTSVTGCSELSAALKKSATLSRSEAEAIRRIKGLVNIASVSDNGATARLVEAL